jgi:hypothetical protein
MATPALRAILTARDAALAARGSRGDHGVKSNSLGARRCCGAVAFEERTARRLQREIDALDSLVVKDSAR